MKRIKLGRLEQTKIFTGSMTGENVLASLNTNVNSRNRQETLLSFLNNSQQGTVSGSNQRGGTIANLLNEAGQADRREVSRRLLSSGLSSQPNDVSIGGTNAQQLFKLVLNALHARSVAEDNQLPIPANATTDFLGWLRIFLMNSLAGLRRSDNNAINSLSVGNLSNQVLRMMFNEILTFSNDAKIGTNISQQRADRMSVILNMLENDASFITNSNGSHREFRGRKIMDWLSPEGSGGQDPRGLFNTGSGHPQIEDLLDWLMSILNNNSYLGQSHNRLIRADRIGYHRDTNGSNAISGVSVVEPLFAEQISEAKWEKDLTEYYKKFWNNDGDITHLSEVEVIWGSNTRKIMGSKKLSLFKKAFQMMSGLPSIIMNESDDEVRINIVPTSLPSSDPKNLIYIPGIVQIETSEENPLDFVVLIMKWTPITEIF